MPVPGKFAIIMPKAMGTSRSGSYFFLIPKYMSKKEMRIIMS